MRIINMISLPCFILGTLLLGVSVNSNADTSSINPTAEVKFNLNESIFSEDKIIYLFEAKENDNEKVYFFDTIHKDFLNNDYILRLRVYQDEKNYDITYKKRFQHSASVNDAINTLTEHGFTGDEKNYKFEIDNKNNKGVLSVSRKEKLKTGKKISYNSVDRDAAVNAILDNSPEKIIKWDSSDWYKVTLNSAKSYGPAIVKTYTGKYLGSDAEIEVWQYNNKKMIEISTKTTSKKMDAVKNIWNKALSEAGYLSADQRGKTNFVIDN